MIDINEVYSFVEEVLNEEKDTFLTDAVKKSILSYFKQHMEEYAFLSDGDKGVLVYEPSDLHILFLLVKKQYRNHDIGSSLLDVLKEKAQELNISRICVNAYGYQKTFYLCNGFEAYGTEDTTGGISVVPMEYLIGRNNIGKKVTVIIDRSYGSMHPTLSDVIYPYNSGYVQQDLAKDDFSFQDAYVIGVEEPLEKFTGYVVGIIYHKDEATSKWIVAPAGLEIDQDRIIQLLGIEEQFYETRFIWSK